MPMKIRRTTDSICVELPLAEAAVLLDELSHVRGGARLPKLKQVCTELEGALALEARQKSNRVREVIWIAQRTRKEEIP